MCVQVAVLADTAFNAEAVDEVAARHMSADCVVRHFWLQFCFL